MNAAIATLLVTATACVPLASGAGPDLIVGELSAPMRWGHDGNIHAYSFGVTTCNQGDEPAAWHAGSPNHPVITMNLYRLHEGRFEQIGMSWVHHGFFALQQSHCQTCTPGVPGSQLGVGCSDVGSASIMGQQQGLGPRSRINPFTGVFEFPQQEMGTVGNIIFKRLQVQEADLTTQGASYFASAQVVSKDESPTGTNSLSWRPVTVGPNFSLTFSGQTRRMQPAVFAWAEAHPQVTLNHVDLPDDGRFWVGALVTDNNDGTWTYEYAVENVNAHRAAKGFTVPIGGGIVSEVGFHDVAYHSGESYSDTDWVSSINDDHVQWKAVVDPFDELNTNALRWGTLYNFRFISTSPPTAGNVTIEPFLVGVLDVVDVVSLIPSAVQCLADFNGDGDVNFFDVQVFLAAFSDNDPSADFNGDGDINFFDVQIFLGHFSAGCA